MAENAMFVSKHRTTTYNGLSECAAAGLHAFCFRLFEKYVPPKSRVLDLGSGKARGQNDCTTPRMKSLPAMWRFATIAASLFDTCRLA